MDSDLFGPLTVGVTALLATLGSARRRRSHAAGRESRGVTIGERIADGGGRAASLTGGVVRSVGELTTGTVTATGENVVAASTAAAAGANRLAGNVASSVASTGVTWAGRTAASTVGLVVDGLAGITEGVVRPLRGGTQTG
jgi:hypothetical protein